MTNNEIFTNEEVPNCWKCKFFAVSWDPKFPYQCKLMGFKSRYTPSLDVLRIDGEKCKGFQKKPIINLNILNSKI
tara:strand:- start:196 stop:420 length:225 start_codon:yes stop_codon:yes gene_type:complete